MTRKTKQGWKSLESMVRHLKARFKKIGLAKEVLPEEITVMEWIQADKTRRRQSRKWTAGTQKREHAG